MIFLTALISLEWRRLEKMSRAPKQDNSKKNVMQMWPQKWKEGDRYPPSTI